MKTLLTSLILPAFLLVFGYYYTKEKPDIRYTLSERIPVKLAEETSSESLQLLEIKNIGSIEAKHIQLVIKASIVSYDLQKYSKADIVNEFHSDPTTEIVYPTLPPEGSFRLLIRSLGDGISKYSLNISHSQGKGKEAFGESNTGFGSLFGISVILIYLSFIAWLVRAGVVDHLESKASYDSASIVRRKSKPFYLSGKRWTSIRNKALEHKERVSGVRDVENAPVYLFLNSNRPKDMNDDEWRSSIKTASYTLSTMLSEASIGSYSSHEVMSLLAVPKPIHFYEEEWAKLVKKLTDILVLMLKKDHRLHTKSGLVKAIKEEKPDQVPGDSWSNYREYLEQEYVVMLSKEIGSIAWNEGSPIEYLRAQPLNQLSQEKTDALEKRAYDLQLKCLPNVMEAKSAVDFLSSERPPWIKESDYESLVLKAKKTVNLDTLTQKYDKLLHIVKSILTQASFDRDKPKVLTEDEWQDLLRISDEFGEYKSRVKTLASDEIQVSTLKVKIERQLDIIHNLLIDPSSVARIEDYSNVFAPGNFENLKLLSGHLEMLFEGKRVT